MLDWYHLIGISSSYDRIKQLTTDIAITLMAKWKANGVVLPSNAMKGVITCCGFDKIDWKIGDGSQETSVYHAISGLPTQCFQRKAAESLTIVDASLEMQTACICCKDGQVCIPCCGCRGLCQYSKHKT